MQTRDMGGPEIVSYEPYDQTEVEAFFGKVWQRSRFPFDPEGAHSDLRRIPAEYQSTGGGFWLMRLTQEIVGTVAIRGLLGKVAEVKRLNVIEEHRGRGLGDQLLRHAVAHAIDTGYRTVRLDTIRNEGPAVHLFKKYGFLEIARYHDNTDADLFMELDLHKTRAGQYSRTAEA